jgi:hypothetical protein
MLKRVYKHGYAAKTLGCHQLLSPRHARHAVFDKAVCLACCAVTSSQHNIAKDVKS